MSCEPDGNYRNPNRGFRIWDRSEIKSLTGDGKYVPNVNDLVKDNEAGFFIVTAVDNIGYSTLERWDWPKEPPNPGLDVLLGSGPGYPSESYRLFVDPMVQPVLAAPDSRLWFYGSMVDHYKIFFGSDISTEHGEVISRFFDQSGNFLSDAIPVNEVNVPDLPNTNPGHYNVKAPAVGYLSRALNNGELVTLVAYSDDGNVVSIAHLIVRNTKAIRHADLGTRYVRSIQIESPFLSSSDPQVLEFPINVPVQSLPMTAVVNYSNGNKLRLGIDGGQAALLGLEDFIASVTGQKFPLVLRYNLSADEVAVSTAPTTSRSMLLEYEARSIAADGAYEVKLFVYPQWVNAANGYRLEYWLYNLDRQTFYNVTPWVELGNTSAPYRPTDYGIEQTITVALNLNEVDGRFAPFRHVQTFKITLFNRGDTYNANWMVYHTTTQEMPFGRDMFADMEYVNTNYWRLRIGNGHQTKESWVRSMFYSIQPLFNAENEVRAPEPTHFRIELQYNTYEFSINQWNEAFQVINDLTIGQLVHIRWIARIYDTDLQLGVSALPVRIRGT